MWLCEYDDYSEAYKMDILNDRPHHFMPAMVNGERVADGSGQIVVDVPPLLLSLDLCQHYHILKLKEWCLSVCLSV